MSVTGHTTLEEAERYTQKAKRRKMANAAMAKLTPHAEEQPKAERDLSHRRNERDNSRRKTEENKGRKAEWRSLGETPNTAKHY